MCQVLSSATNCSQNRQFLRWKKLQSCGFGTPVTGAAGVTTGEAKLKLSRMLISSSLTLADGSW